MTSEGKTWNPFADAEDKSPFSDPSVQQARSGPTRIPTLAEYNPFDESNTTTYTQPSPSVPPPASPDLPPPYTNSAAQPAPVNLQMQQEDLDRKADELQRKEIELQKQISLSTVRINNFPPLPKCCPCKPCFYQDISIEIAQEYQRLVRMIFIMWIAYSLLLIINTIGLMACFAVASECSVRFGLSLIHLFLGPPLSFFCWFRALYRAFRNDSSICFFWFFFIIIFQIIYCVLFAIWPVTGTCSWILSFDLLGGNRSQKAVGALVLCIAALFTTFAILFFVTLIKINAVYRRSGASFQKAQEEFATGVFTNKAVQQTAAGVGTAVVGGAVQGAVSNMTVTTVNEKY